MIHPFIIGLLLTTTAAADQPTQANVLLIVADDIGYEALGCYGGQDFRTPRLDAMAASGVRFARAYASPVCTPTRVSLHTGLYTARHGHLGVLPVHRGTDKKVDLQSRPTFASLARGRGYATAVTGKWQLATLERWPGHIHGAGFDSWCVWQIWRDGRKTTRHWTPTLNHDGGVRMDVADRFGPDVLADYVIEQMRSARDAGRPFLIVHNELLPHEPIVQTPQDRRLGRDASLGHMIEYMDGLTGRLLDAVEELGLRDNTYVLFLGDNGTHEEDFVNPRAGLPGERPHTRHTNAGRVDGGKAHLNDAGTHVPLLAWGPPGVPPGTVCEDLIDVVDLYPTVCELTDTPLPPDLPLDGRSFAPQVYGRAGQPRDWVHHAIAPNGGRAGGAAVFDGSFRLTDETAVLTDARNLPAETDVQTPTPEATAARERLKAVLRSLDAD